MKPLVVVVGATYEDARRYVLAHRAGRPILNSAVLVSASASAGTADGRRVHKVIETPGARFGRNYGQVMPVLLRCVQKTKPLT